jgi:glutamate 5-kinase
MKRMELPARPKGLAAVQVGLPECSRAFLIGLQALAAIGQGRLIALWDNLFGQLGQPIAQVLLTRGDLSDVCALPQSGLSSILPTVENAIPQCCEYFW